MRHQHVVALNVQHGDTAAHGVTFCHAFHHVKADQAHPPGRSARRTLAAACDPRLQHGVAQRAGRLRRLTACADIAFADTVEEAHRPKVVFVGEGAAVAVAVVVLKMQQRRVSGAAARGASQKLPRLCGQLPRAREQVIGIPARERRGWLRFWVSGPTPNTEARREFGLARTARR